MWAGILPGHPASVVTPRTREGHDNDTRVALQLLQQEPRACVLINVASPESLMVADSLQVPFYNGCWPNLAVLCILPSYPPMHVPLLAIMNGASKAMLLC